MNKLEAKLKLLTPQYWMDEGQRVGYQSANPLPPTQAELTLTLTLNPNPNPNPDPQPYPYPYP